MAKARRLAGKLLGQPRAAVVLQAAGGDGAGPLGQRLSALTGAARLQTGRRRLGNSICLLMLLSRYSAEAALLTAGGDATSLGKYVYLRSQVSVET